MGVGKGGKRCPAFNRMESFVFFNLLQDLGIVIFLTIQAALGQNKSTMSGFLEPRYLIAERVMKIR
jgi:hypothetical protein